MLNINKKNRIRAYVSQQHSYAFGRSNDELHYNTIGELLTKRAESEEKTKTAIISYHENICKTYEQLNSDVNQLANGLYNKLGLRRGDVIGVWCCNSYKWVQIQYASAKLGLILCTINPVYLAQELNYTLKKAQIKALFMPGVDSQQEIVNKFYKILDDTLKISDNENTDSLKLKQVILLDGKKPSINNHEINLIMFESLLTNEQTNRSEDQNRFADDPAYLMFTSGTTGKPKVAILSHFSITNNARLAGSYISNSTDVKVCSPLPLFHIFGAGSSILMTAKPAALVLTGFKYDVKQIVDSIVNHGCTHIFLAPTMIIDILNYIEKNSIKLENLKGVLIGGSTVTVGLCNKITSVFPHLEDFIILYGTTETVVIASNSIGSTIRNFSEADVSPLDFVEIKLEDPKSGTITKIGEKGELLCRGYNVMIGYWRDEKKTNESINETKWYRTGDLAVMDEFGNFKIIGRIKDIIIRGGENINPIEIEELLHTNPQVIEAYVIGVPDERLGEEVCAWIKLRANSNITSDDIKDYCKDKISYFKIPRYILFVNDFPRTPSGKVKKFELRENSRQMLGL